MGQNVSKKKNISQAGGSTGINSATQTALNLKQNSPLRESMVDTNKVFSAGKTEVYQSVVLTAPRTLTLPAANAFSAGTELVYVDEIGGVTLTNTVTLTRAGSDLINGSSTQVLNVQYGTYKMITDGVSVWTLLNNASLSSGTWTPTVTGYSSNTATGAFYTINANMCTAIVRISGTSNTSAKTVTLPFNRATGDSSRFALGITDSAVANGVGLATLPSASNVLTVYVNVTAGAWTGSGTAIIWVVVTYPI